MSETEIHPAPQPILHCVECGREAGLLDCGHDLDAVGEHGPWCEDCGKPVSCQAPRFAALAGIELADWELDPAWQVTVFPNGSVNVLHVDGTTILGVDGQEPARRRLARRAYAALKAA